MPEGTPPILACAGDDAVLARLDGELAFAGLAAQMHRLDVPVPANLASYRLVVIDPTAAGAAALDFCRAVRAQLDEAFVPVLFLGGEANAPTRRHCLEAGADACLTRPLAAQELTAQAKALFRIRDAQAALAARAAEAHRVNARLRQLHNQIDHELKLAQRIQSSFLPQSLPQVPRVRFGVYHLQRDRVGGDFYDVFRLDENHLGLYVADAMGHGVPASLLTIFVKKGVRAKEVFGQQYRLVPPDEVLQRLNRDLLEQELPENPFITMVYCLYNHHDGALSFARAGHPYPLYVPANGEPELWRQEGLLLGVVDAHFPARCRVLQPGDKLLLYSDGIDEACIEGNAPGTPSLLAAVGRHRAKTAPELVEAVARDLFASGQRADDVTLFALEATS